MDGNLLDRLTQEYHAFTKAQKKVTDYILSHKKDVQYMTIADLAEVCGVVPSTLTLFCRRLGCDGFSQFKLELAKVGMATQDSDLAAESYTGIQRTDDVSALCQKVYQAEMAALSQTYLRLDPEMVSRAADLLAGARQVFCFGHGTSSILAMEAWGRFVTITTKFHWVQDSHLQAETAALMGPDDVVLCFSFSGLVRDLIHTLKAAARRGAKILLLTRYLNSPAAAVADVCLLCGYDEGPLESGSVAGKQAQLLVLDVMFNEYYRRDPEGTLRARELTSEAISQRLY